MERKAQFGSISTGTMVPADLIDAFHSELEWLGHGERAAEIEERAKDDDDDDGRLQDLFDALEELAPPYAYFGAHPGDGADYGFWLCDDVAQLVADDGGLVVDDTAEVPEDYAGEVLFVNERGNATLYVAQPGEGLEEVWSVV